jgi:GNAT superfamily N-acetyltransferase
MTTIRVLEPSDLPCLVKLCAEHAAFEQASYDVMGKEEKLAKVIFADATRLFVWVAEQQNRLVGYASVTLEFSTWDAATFAHLDCLYLQEHARSQGTGKKLLETVLDFARSKGCVNVQWQTPVWNIEAQKFYAQFGVTQHSKERFILSLHGHGE